MHQCVCRTSLLVIPLANREQPTIGWEYLNSAGEVVLILSVLFLGLALLGLLGRADRSRLTAAWVAMAGFAVLATFCCWEGIQLNRSASPVYYELRTMPGDQQQLTLYRRGSAPGYRGRLVHRKDHSFDKDLIAKLAACSWRIGICERLELSEHTFNQDGVFEFESEYPDVVLRYEVTPQTRPILEGVALELSCPVGFHTVIAQHSGALKVLISIYIGGLLLSAFGVGVQRRKMRRLQVTAPEPSTSSPRSL